MNHEAFLDELEKIAITRAARELMAGTLSPAAASRVRGVLRPPETMASGLERGSTALAKRLGVPVHEGTFRESLKEVPGLLAKVRAGAKPSTEELKRVGTPALAAIGGGGVTLGKLTGQMAGVYLHKGQPMIRAMAARQAGGPIKGRIGALKELVGKGLSKNERAHLDAIIKRHEIDEARAMARKSSFMNQRSAMWTPGWKPVPFTKGHVRQGGGMHADPRVLMEESRHLTFAPEKVRKTMRTLRKTTGEQQGMLERAGVDMGKKTPAPATRAARVAEKKLMNVPTATYPTAGPPVHFSPEAQKVVEGLGQRIGKTVQRFRGS